MTFSKELLSDLARDPVAILNRGYRATERIAARRDRLQRWREAEAEFSEYLDESETAMPILALREELFAELQELAGYEIETGCILRRYITKPNLLAVLEHRYLEYKSWEVIAVEMGYTFRWTQELHRQAIQQIKAAAFSELKRKRVNS